MRLKFAAVFILAAMASQMIFTGVRSFLVP